LVTQRNHERLRQDRHAVLGAEVAKRQHLHWPQLSLSTDRGETWTRIRGYNFKWGQRVIADPKDASKIYVTTFGGSVWHGPAAGDATAAEDVVK